MTEEEEQKVLLQIIATWQISERPEFRGFRCAYCQQYKNKAWHHWVNTGGYKLPVHMCNDTCETSFQNNSIQIDESQRRRVVREVFGESYKYSIDAVKRFREIVASWPDYKKPALKAFTCDECNKQLGTDTADGVRKGYHVWWKMDDNHTLAELHFHKECAAPLGIKQ